MSKTSQVLKLIARIILLMLLAFLTLVLLVAFGFNEGLVEAPFHLLAGFGFFLARNIPAISVNAATWGPGLLAFLLALAVGHRFLKRRAIRQGGDWSFKTTFSLGLFVPVLFVIAFIVPGILLQMNLLRQSPWFEHQRNQRAFLRMTLRNYAQACYCLAEEAPEKRFPETLEVIEEKGLMELGKLSRFGDSTLPPEPFIYLGAGQTISSDETLPLCISPPYQRDGTTFREVITIGGVPVEIRDEDLDSWIDRAFQGIDRPPGGP